MLKTEASIPPSEQTTSHLPRQHETPSTAITAGNDVRNLATRRHMADELVERGLSWQAAARLLRLDHE